uniref:LRAT domain-containing protein n=1 Tax=viral metagenome TaxID=1070528 RepID=A0A6C0IXI2_9ZZZZ
MNKLLFSSVFINLPKSINLTLNKGDHISIKRNIKNLTSYRHHGIYIGNDEVIHYSDENMNPITAEIKKTSINKFIGKSDIKTLRILYYEKYNLNTIYSNKSFEPYTVVARAYSRLGEKSYNILNNNCEHFANYCKVGISKSIQSDNIINRLIYLRDGIDNIIKYAKN